jgi:hypothetical protein
MRQEPFVRLIVVSCTICMSLLCIWRVYKPIAVTVRRLLEVPFDLSEDKSKGVKSLFKSMIKTSNEDKDDSEQNNSNKRLSRRERRQRKNGSKRQNNKENGLQEEDEEDLNSSESESKVWIPGKKGHFLKSERVEEEMIVEQSDEVPLVTSHTETQSLIGGGETLDDKIQLYSSHFTDNSSSLMSKTVSMNELINNPGLYEGHLPYPPWLPYHAPQEQTHSENTDRPYIPSLKSASVIKRAGESLLKLASSNPIPQGTYIHCK